MILPAASKSLGVEITAGEASISPFSHVDLRQVKIQSTGTEPLLTVDEIRLVYHLREILGGNIHVDEVTVNSPVVQIITNPDGTSNLDPLLKKSSPSQPAPSKPSPPPNLNIVKVALNNATVRLVKLYAGGTSDTSVLSNVNVTLENLRNGQTAKITLAAGIGVDNHPPAPGTNASMQAALAGNFSVALAQNLVPGSVTGSTRLDVQKAGGALADLAGLSASLNCEASATNLTQLSLQFQQGGADLGQIRVSGPLDRQKMEGRLTLDIPSIDRRVLNLAAAGSGLDFGPARLSSTNLIELAKGGQSLTFDGQFNATSLALSQHGQAVPTLDFHANYGVSLNRADSSLLLRSFAVNGLQNQRPLMRIDLTSPMQISLANPGLAGSSALNLAVTNFNLAEWKPFLGTNALGSVDLNLNLLSSPAGQHLELGVNGRVGEFVFNHFQTTWDVNATVTNHLLHLAKASGSVRDSVGAGGAFDFAADYDLANNAGQVTVKISDLNQNALRPFLDPSLGAQKLGSVSISANVSASLDGKGGSTVKGNLGLTNLVLRDPVKLTNSPPLSLGFRVDASFSNQVADVRQLEVDLAPTARASNQITLSGRVDLSHSNAVQGQLKLASPALDLTQYYDTFAAKSEAAKSNAATAAASPATTSAPAAATAGEPAAIKLPLQDFTFTADLGRVYLREIAITNFQLTTRLDPAHVILKPFQMNLNGAPVTATADVDLSTPGYKYEVAFSAQKVPLAPFADTFSPDYSGRASGNLFASAQVKGAGITGPNLKKNLSGQVDVLLTNAAVDLGAGKRAQFFMNYLINPIFIALRLPSVSHAVLGLAAVDAKVAGGNVDLSQFRAMAAEFTVRSQGTLTLANVLTNSTINDLPVILALPPAAAKKAGLATANAGQSADYVDLGKVATVGGTFGDPKLKIDYSAIALLTGKAVLGAADAIGGDAGKILKDVKGVTGGILGGDTSTNGASSNKSIINSIRSLNPFQR